MGSCKSKHPVLVVEEVAKRRNGEIEKNIEEEKKHTQMKLLLLGTAESGKSTLLKQMRILHEQGFSEQELSTQKAIVYATIIDSMATLIRAMDTLGIIPTKKSTHVLERFRYRN
uniref:Uncharacterized protein n=1 Tax=Plectus sambesii TaxID=2011161 RepID=A0A914XCG5_9BILA